jgi:hypothetical protein
MTFEVNETCRGATWERKKDADAASGAMWPGDRLVVSFRDLDAFLRFVDEYGPVRVSAPRPGRLPRLYRLELRRH